VLFRGFSTVIAKFSTVYYSFPQVFHRALLREGLYQEGHYYGRPTIESPIIERALL
jgi:hypothetical protein